MTTQMNPTDAEIDKIRGEISRLCSDIWSNGFDAEGPDDKDFCHEFAEIDVILEGLYGRAVVERVNGGTSLYHDFFIAWNRCESNRGCYSCCEPHDCRCEKERGISKVCTCGRDELEAIETKIDEQEGAI